MPEEPIVVSGGSVTVDFSDHFQNDAPSPGKRKYKRDGRLIRVEVNGKKVADLSDKDKVSIIYET